MWLKIILGLIIIAIVGIIIFFTMKKRYIIIPRVITSDVIGGIDYIVPKPIRARFVAIKTEKDSETQYIRPEKECFFAETYDVDGKNDLLSVRLLVVSVVGQDYTISGCPGKSIVFRRNGKLYLTNLNEHKIFCKDYRYMKDTYGHQRIDEPLKTDIRNSPAVKYNEVVGVVRKIFDCYKPMNKKEGIA